MKLYDEKLPAPNPRRVRMYLAEKGLTIPLVHVPMRERAHKSDEFKLKNSLGQLPVLELDDGTTICETVSICRYLEELNPEPPLFGRSAIERAQIDMWVRRLEFVLMNPVRGVWVHTHPFTARLGTQYKDYGESNREGFARAMVWLDREIEGREYVAPGGFSMADIVALSIVDFANFVGLPMPDDCVRLKAWHARVSARESATA